MRTPVAASPRRRPAGLRCLLSCLLAAGLAACGGGTGPEAAAPAAPDAVAQAAVVADPPADQDRDGVPDTADNCIRTTNANQRDTDADGFGNACDADLDNNGRVDATDQALLRKALRSRAGDARFNPDADFDGNGLVDSADLAVLRASLRQAPGPAGRDAGPDPEGDRLALALTGSAQAQCAAPQSHLLQLQWQLDPVAGPVRVDLSVLSPDGQRLLRQVTTPGGSLTLTLHAPRGGPALVLARAVDVAQPVDGDSALARRQLTLVLPPCVADPAPQPPTIGFVDPPAQEPPVIGAPGGTPTEVDLVHLGGSTGGPAPVRLVAAAGSGAGFKLYSFGQREGEAPSLLAQTAPLAGRDVKLHTLSPALSPKLEVAPFVSGVRRDDHNLWLSAWQVLGTAGEMRRFGVRGYGANAGIQVLAYAMAHRVLPNRNFQVVTPLRHASNPSGGPAVPRLRFVTWEITTDGQVIGRADSGDFGTPHATAEPSVLHLRDDLYVLTYRGSDDALVTHYWHVRDDGRPQDAFASSSGLDHNGDEALAVTAWAHTALPVGPDGLLTPLVGEGNVFGLPVWETRLLSWGEGGVSWRPYRVSDITWDALPDAPGLGLAEPTVTDATDKDSGALLARVRARLSDGLLEQNFGFGEGVMFSQMPAGEPVPVHIASVTKNMVLLLAVEAIARGEASLDDPVTISATAANLTGSQMGMDKEIDSDDLQPGETQTLRTLLYGMMLRSGNDAAAAIAEHLAGAGAFSDFVARMNERAGQLGLLPTLYGETEVPAGAPAGGAISTPQDQITLLRLAVQQPLFAEIASAQRYDACGTDLQGQPRCYFLTKLYSRDYPGLGSWKNGNGGFKIDPSFSPYSADGGPYCEGSGCLVAQATRLGRSLYVGLQQSGSRWGDAERLFTYGYRRLFTPDKQVALTAVEDVRDFALDALSDTQGVSIAAREGAANFSLCAWQMVTGIGQLQQTACREIVFSGVAAGVEPAPVARLDGVRISTLQADDYLIGHRNGDGDLRLHLWRVAPREP